MYVAKMHVVFRLATGALLTLCLFLYVNPKKATADFSELFASPVGSGEVCTQQDPCELRIALSTASSNGEDDILYLVAGIYEGNFDYFPEDGKSLVVKGEPGTSIEDVVLDGGGSGAVLYLNSSSEGGSVRVEGLTIQNGTESGLRVYAKDGSLDVVLSNVVVQSNMNEYRGGGIFLSPEGSADIDMEIWNSVIRYNRSPGFTEGGQGRGGGIAAISRYGNSSIDLLIVNSLIYRNQANWTGGGMEVNSWEVGDHNVARAVVINSTITGNASNMHDMSDNPGEGDGIRVYAYDGNGSDVSLDIYNSIIYNNTAINSRAAQDLQIGESGPGSTTVNAYHSDIGDVVGDQDVYNSVNLISSDPAFVDPSNDDYHLTDDSSCIDAGTNFVPTPPGLPDTDFEGDPRISGDAPDIGADETRTEN